MCTTCGCGTGETRLEGDGHHHEHDHAHPHDHEHAHPHVHADGTVHAHAHPHSHAHPHDHGDGAGHAHVHDPLHAPDAPHAHEHHDLHYGNGPAHAHAPGLSQARMVQIEQDILSKNDRHARYVREALRERGVFALNLVSSPGSGKTSLLVASIRALQGTLAVAVIEGDQQTTADADRIRATGARALQINTGKGCHLDASMVERALERLVPAEDSVLFVENVGNLVCPAAFDLGEAHKVVVLSVTEGEDKPLKYPDMFRAASLMLLNKVDLLPHLSFDVDRCIEYARRVNPDIAVLQVSATHGTGMDAWLDWVRVGAAAAAQARHGEVARLQARIAELEAQLAAPRAG